MVFTAREPTDRVPMNVSVSNLRASSPLPGAPLDMFDVIITYGPRIETFRGVASSTVIRALRRMLGSTAILDAGVGGAAGRQQLRYIDCGEYHGRIRALPCRRASPRLSAHKISSASSKRTVSLDKVEIFNLLLVPGVADNLVVSAALTFAERKRAFAILDPPPTATADGPGSIDKLMNSFPKSQNGALDFPYLLSTDPITTTILAEPPSGFVAGIYATTDASRGVWKAPAGLATTLRSTTGPVITGMMNDPRQGVLNLASVNCLRTFTGVGTVVWAPAPWSRTTTLRAIQIRLGATDDAVP